jgi:hypothetical protein
VIVAPLALPCGGRSTLAGEQAAAGAAIERLLEQVGPRPEQETELKFSLPDLSDRLFVGVCRKHGVRPLTSAAPHDGDGAGQ